MKKILAVAVLVLACTACGTWARNPLGGGEGPVKPDPGPPKGGFAANN